jgi:Na+/H+-dicarboxylate symporter
MEVLMRLMKQSLLVLVLVLFCVGCATFASSTYKTLYVAGISYDMAMKSVSRLQAQGMITPEQRAAINELANYYYISYHASVDAFEIYKKVETVENKQKLLIVMNLTSESWIKLASYVNRIQPGTLALSLEGVE